MSNLYEIGIRYQHLISQDELTENECKELDLMHDNIQDACIARAKYIRNLHAELKNVEEARKEMQEREKSLKSKIDNHEKWLIDNMVNCGLDLITKSPLFAIKIKNNPPKVDDFSPDFIPEKFFKTKVVETKSLDKNAIKDAIQSGESIPGARLISDKRIEFK